MGGEVKAGKEAHQKTAVPLHSYFIGPFWVLHVSALASDQPCRTRRAETGHLRSDLLFRPWWRDLEALGTEGEMSLMEKKDREEGGWNGENFKRCGV